MAIRHLKKFYHQLPVLITGGLGFIGSNLAIKLVELNAKVTILDDLTQGLGGNRFNIKPITNQVTTIIGNLKDQHLLKKTLPSQRLIFNLAGSHSHIDSMRQPLHDLSLTCRPHLSLLEACRKYNPQVKIIMAGTRNQYGKPQYLPVDENHPLKPLDINGAHWLAVENYHLLYHRVYGLKTCSLRLSNTYGPQHQMKHPFQGVLNWFIRLILDDQPITLFGGGQQKRDAVYIDDVTQAFLLAGACQKIWGKCFNVGGHPTSLANFAKLTLKISGRGKIKKLPFPKQLKRIEVGDFITDWSKIKKTVGWKPNVSLARGIKKTLEFYEKYRSHYW